MFNVGMGEIAVIAILGLIIFGPDRLPRAVRTISAGLRTLRASATEATQSLRDAAGWDGEQTRQTMDEIAQLHPKRIVSSILEAPDETQRRTGRQSGAPTSVPPPAGKLGDFDPDSP